MKTLPNNSLLPYLNPHPGGFHLEVTHGGQETENAASPFVLASENDLLSRVIKGRIVTDAGITVKDVLLLLQRDEYLFSSDSFCTINNLDVERAWQDAFVSYLEDGKKDVLLLSKQMGATGELARMDPLFLCRKRNLFFPPPCPICGLPLEQCEDDELLTLAGLRTYSQSLERYLYCATCSNRGAFRFYTYETNDGGPPGVENRFDLIRQLGSLVPSSDEASAFPCGACQFRNECYGAEQKALALIVPFGFYPFYMLIVSPPTLNMWGREQGEGKENAIAAREHALRLGWALVASIGKGQNEQFSGMGVPQRLEMLREGIKEDALLAEMGATPIAPILAHQETSKDEISTQAVANEEVCRILTEIRRDWSNRLSESASSPAVETSADEDTEESVETVFLNIADLEQFGSPDTTKTENEALETVMPSPARIEPAEDTEKTVILSAAPIEEAHYESQIDMEKTVILNMGQMVESVAPASPPAPPAQKEVSPKERQVEIEETVIISADYYAAGPDAAVSRKATEPEAGAVEGGAATQPPPKEEEDLIEATVILNISDRSRPKGNR